MQQQYFKQQSRISGLLESTETSVGGKYCFIQTNDPDLMPAQKKDVEALRDEIARFRKERPKGPYASSSPDLAVDSEPLLDVQTSPSQPLSPLGRMRLCVSLLCALLAGVFLASAVLSPISNVERLLVAAMALPALGTAAAASFALMKGPAYDEASD